jgi:hypothetical protein
MFSSSAMERRRRSPCAAVVMAAVAMLAVMPAFPGVAADLSAGYYSSSCPKLESIVRYEVSRKINETVVTIPAVLRLFFHDCLVTVSSISSSSWIKPFKLLINQSHKQMLVGCINQINLVLARASHASE